MGITGLTYEILYNQVTNNKIVDRVGKIEPIYENGTMGCMLPD
jgi:hypothetical protein